MARPGRATVALALALALLFALAWATRLPALPGFEEVRAAWRPSEAWLLDRHGEALSTRRIDLGVRRFEWTPLDAISPALIDAVIAGEDRRFHRHLGVDWLALGGAAWDTLRGRPRGASTLTMQLAAMLHPGLTARAGHRGIRAKLMQLRLAGSLGRAWTREQVLEAYLNLLSYRGELQGIGAAARVLAGKAPAGLTMDEARVLAALLPQPSASPTRVARRACARPPALASTSGTTARPAGDCAALEATARRMLDPRARRAAAAAADASRSMDADLAPHLAASLLREPGERVRTTLDARLQLRAREILERQLQGLEGRNVRDAAAIVVDNASGAVLAYVGSAGASSTAAHVDGVRARRQAGSTLKPFLFALALEQRTLTAASLLEDSPVALDTGAGLYMPRDYDNAWRGPVSVRTALAGSLNVPAVRALLLTGIEPFRTRLNALGYAGIDRDGEYYGFSLALGSAEVSLWEQAVAYRALARGGLAAPLRLTARPPEDPVRVLDPGPAWLVADILADAGARAITFGMDSALGTPYWSAVKTGTSKDLRDNWCVGFSPAYTVAVWVGNFEGDSMRGVSGVSGAAPAWRQIMDALHEGGAPPAPLPPAALARAPLRYAGNIEPPREEWYLPGTQPGATVQAVDAHARLTRITNPADGTVIVLDPDIPPEAQRVPITAEGVGEGYLIQATGLSAPAGSGPLLWRPVRGAHDITLMDKSRVAVDRVRIVVR